MIECEIKTAWKRGYRKAIADYTAIIDTELDTEKLSEDAWQEENDLRRV